MRSSPLAVDCPSCNEKVQWTPESMYRPFCSERCRMLDLGAWASEVYAVEGPSVHEENQAIDPRLLDLP